MKNKVKRNYKRLILYGDYAEYAKMRLLLQTKGISVSEWFRAEVKRYIKENE